MNCPVCDTQLAISSREGIEIDYCGQCRGVWLDRGELDKIIERAGASLAPGGPAPAGPGGGPRDDRRYERYDPPDRYERDRNDPPERDDDRRPPHKRRKRRGSFLEELFDFD